MNTYIIVPNQSLGELKLGMQKSEIDSLFSTKKIEEKQISSLTFKGEEKTNLLFVRYDNSKFTVLYDSSYRAIEICAAIRCFEPGELMLYDMDLLQTRVEDIIPSLGKCSSYTYDDEEDEDLSTEYTFDSLGISLWRESGFHSKLLTSDDFLGLSLENQEYEKRFMFFESIALA